MSIVYRYRSRWLFGHSVTMEEMKSENELVLGYIYIRTCTYVKWSTRPQYKLSHPWPFPWGQFQYFNRKADVTLYIKLKEWKENWKYREIPTRRKENMTSRKRTGTEGSEVRRSTWHLSTYIRKERLINTREGVKQGAGSGNFAPTIGMHTVAT